MRRTAILRKSVKQLEHEFKEVDQTVAQALKSAWAEEAEQEPKDQAPKITPLQRAAATPELLDVLLPVNTKLGSEILLVKPTSGNPTGLTELFEHPHPRETLLKIYDHTLSLLGDKFPASSVYRTSVENVTKARRDIVSQTKENLQIEQKIGAGLVEEILVQAAEEFRLAEELAEAKPWEDLEEKPVEGQWVAHEFNNEPTPTTDVWKSS